MLVNMCLTAITFGQFEFVDKGVDLVATRLPEVF